MSRAGKSHTSEDSWQLSVDDRLPAPKESARLSDRGPFVINLSTSAASIGTPPKVLRRFDGLHLYQLRRGPEDRPRFLLRLGIIATEVEADAILSEVLANYPCATRDLAEDDDRASVAAKVCPAEKPQPAQPLVERPPGARLPPNAGPPAPHVAAKPEERFRWNIDEVLPNLAVTFPPRREPEGRKGGPPGAREPRASRESASPRETVPLHGPPALPKAPPLRETPASREPSAHAKPSAPPQLESLEAVASPSEIGLSVPAPAVAPTLVPSALERLSAEASPALGPATVELHDVRIDQAARVAAESTASSLPMAARPGVGAQVPAAIESPGASDLAAPGPTVVPATLAIAEAPPADIAIPVAARAPVENHRALRAPAACAGNVTATAASSASIGAPVESARTHDKDTNSPQDPGGAVSPAAAPAKPDGPISAGAMARSAERPVPQSRVPAERRAPGAAPVIDSTQTVRALTPLELDDDQTSQWFSIQLVLSKEHIDPEHVPSLDIFNEYRLYSVTGLDHDCVMHALRLGFFSSALAAEAVAGYLSGFFGSPSIKRVSLAERERFATGGVTAGKDIGATGRHAVIELPGAKSPLPERHIEVSNSGKPRAPRSVWSRLDAPLKR